MLIKYFIFWVLNNTNSKLPGQNTETHLDKNKRLSDFQKNSILPRDKRLRDFSMKINLSFLFLINHVFHAYGNN